jgi:hypothetical protein
MQRRAYPSESPLSEMEDPRVADPSHQARRTPPHYYRRRSAAGLALTSSLWLSSQRAYVRTYPVALTNSSRICCS